MLVQAGLQGGARPWLGSTVWKLSEPHLPTSAAREEERHGDRGRCGKDSVGRSPFLFGRLLPWVVVSRWGF